MVQKWGHFLAREILGLICSHDYLFILSSGFLMQNAETVSDFHAVMATPLSIPKLS